MTRFITPSDTTSLTQVLAYSHPGVVRRYCKEHNALPREAEEIFQEMLKFLYVCYRAGKDGPEGFGIVVSSEIEKLDWMWHTFLLFTKDYAEFCDRYFGFFLDHLPTEDEEDEQEQTAWDEESFRTAVKRQFALIYDVLGEETLTAWYDECRFAAK